MRHLVQAAEVVAPAVVEYLPDWHRVQAEELDAPAAVTEYVPAPHRVHVLDSKAALSVE